MLLIQSSVKLCHCQAKLFEARAVVTTPAYHESNFPISSSYAKPKVLANLQKVILNIK